jgi:uncharacterized protein
MPMRRPDFVLAALSVAEGASFTPAQVQKLFFLLDRNIAPLLGGEQFHFVPYDYGPFDHDVYRELEQLNQLGLVEISFASNDRLKLYRLSPRGLENGLRLLSELADGARSYAQRASEWVLAQSFASLVTGIYNAYPDMRVNSVFRE